MLEADLKVEAGEEEQVVRVTRGSPSLLSGICDG